MSNLTLETIKRSQDTIQLIFSEVCQSCPTIKIVRVGGDEFGMTLSFAPTIYDFDDADLVQSAIEQLKEIASEFTRSNIDIEMLMDHFLSIILSAK